MEEKKKTQYIRLKTRRAQESPNERECTWRGWGDSALSEQNPKEIVSDVKSTYFSMREHPQPNASNG